MKSRISFFNPTVFRKNLTRFAPAWGLYAVLLLMTLLVMSGGTGCAFELTYIAQGLALITFPYGLLVALLIFGDLFNPRMCNALHAMPVRRESLFMTNLLSGLSFSLIPTLLALVIALGLSGDPDLLNGAISPLVCFAVMNLQFLFFFGTAVLCAFLVGSRVAMTLVYGIINFASLLIFWFVDTLFTPLLYGLRTPNEPALLLCPVVQMSGCNYIEIHTELLGVDDRGAQMQDSIVISDGWGYLAICAVIGVVFMALALVLYRRRKLECAGDFMAEKAAEPVFLVVYSMAVGCVFQLMWQVFVGIDIPVLAFFGLVVGFFTGLMLLRRTVRVFNLKALGGCAVLVAALGLSLGMTALDPLGIESWMPEPTEVKSVKLYQYHSLHDSPGNAITLDSTEDIEAILQVHEAAMELEDAVISTEGWIQLTPKDEKVYIEKLRQFQFTLEYRLENGVVVRRYYKLWLFMEEADILKGFFTSVKCVLGVQESELPQLAQELDYIQLDTYQIYDYQERLSLLQAIAADCKAGTMAQNWVFRGGDDTWETVMDIYCAANMERLNSGAWYYGPESFQINIQVFDQNENILNWMKEHNVPTYQYIELGK